MEQSSLLLSICIPTYRQPKAVDRLLRQLVPQLTPEVEIIVRDDSPDDETERIVKAYQSKGTPISYFRGIKEGIDPAIIFLTKEARGKYVWWFGNDEMREGAIAKVLNVIRNHPEISLILMNYQVFDQPLPAFGFGSDRFFKDRDEVMEIAVGNLGFITVTPFRRENALPALELSRKYIGSAFVNLYIVLYVLAHGEKFYFVNPAYVLSHPNTPEEVDENGFEVFGVNFLLIVREFKRYFRWKTIRCTLGKNFSHVWRGMLVRFASGYESPRGKRWLMIRYYWSYPIAWMVLPLMFLPRAFARRAYQLYRIFFKNRRLKIFT